MDRFGKDNPVPDDASVSDVVLAALRAAVAVAAAVLPGRSLAPTRATKLTRVPIDTSHTA